MKPTELAFNRALGMAEPPPGSRHLLELPLTPAVLNHVGTAHAAAQFALAEAASAACLQKEFAAAVGNVFAVVRGSTLKYRKPASRGSLRAFATPDDATREHLVRDLQTRTRTSATVLVELQDDTGNVTFTGSFQWFIARAEGDAASTP